MLSFPCELFLVLKRGPNSVLIVLERYKWRENEQPAEEMAPCTAFNEAKLSLS